MVGNKPVTEADIQHFKYITSVIKETLRIQPIIPELGRYNTEEGKVYFVVTVVISFALIGTR